MGNRWNLSNLKLASDSSSKTKVTHGEMILNRPVPTGSSRGSLSKTVLYRAYSIPIERESSQEFKTDRRSATGKLRLVKQTSWLNVKYCFFDQIRGERAQSSQKSADAGQKL